MKIMAAVFLVLSVIQGDPDNIDQMKLWGTKIQSFSKWDISSKSSDLNADAILR